MNIYALKDNCTGRFYPPFYAESDVAAISQIKENLLSPAGVQILRLKEQLQLFYLGIIDFDRGLIFSNTHYDDLVASGSFDVLDNDSRLIVTNRAVIFVAEIAEQLPKKVLNPELTHEDLKRVYAEIKELSTQLSQLGEAYNSHKHTKKGAYLIDDQKKF